MARLPPQPSPLVTLNRFRRSSAMSISTVPIRPPTKPENNSSIRIPSLAVKKSSAYPASAMVYREQIMCRLLPISLKQHLMNQALLKEELIESGN